MYPELGRCLRELLTLYPEAHSEAWRVRNWLADHKDVPGAREYSIALVAVADHGLKSFKMTSLDGRADELVLGEVYNRAWSALTGGGITEEAAAIALKIWLQALGIETPRDIQPPRPASRKGTVTGEPRPAPPRPKRRKPSPPGPLSSIKTLRCAAHRIPCREEMERRVSYESLGTKQVYLRRDSLPHIAKRLSEVVETEGPVSQERAISRVILAWNTTRTSEDIRAQFVRGLNLIAAHERPVIRDGFLWPRHLDPVTWRSYRRSSDTESPRQLGDISVEELANAADDILFDAGPMTRDELIGNIALCFGRPLNAANSKRIDKVIDGLLQTKRIEARSK